MKLTVLMFACAVFMLSGCNDNRDVYTLYRTSPLDPNMRIHMATFDADESSPTYNQENCQLAADLFTKQPGVTVRYWCEKGRYRP
ncbi:MAG: hypothetical protein OEL53_08700 [Rhodospirillales bacterium]|nr:hypothetical protein [Rhodospirillales bacterium]